MSSYRTTIRPSSVDRLYIPTYSRYYPYSYYRYPYHYPSYLESKRIQNELEHQRRMDSIKTEAKMNELRRSVDAEARKRLVESEIKYNDLRRSLDLESRRREIELESSRLETARKVRQMDLERESRRITFERELEKEKIELELSAKKAAQELEEARIKRELDEERIQRELEEERIKRELEAERIKRELEDEERLKNELLDSQKKSQELKEQLEREQKIRDLERESRILELENSIRKSRIYDYSTPKKLVEDYESSPLKESAEKLKELEDEALYQALRDRVYGDQGIEDLKRQLALRSDFNHADAFATFDRFNRGLVSQFDAKSSLNSFGIFPTDEQMNLFFKRFTTAGYMNESALAAALSPYSSEYALMMSSRSPNPLISTRSYHNFSPETAFTYKQLLNKMFDNEVEAELLRTSLYRRPLFSAYDAYDYLSKYENFYTLEEYKRFLDTYSYLHRYPDYYYTPLYKRYESYYDWKLNKDLQESAKKLEQSRIEAEHSRLRALYGV